MNSDLQIREATKADWPHIWAIIEPTYRAGETYVYPRDISEEDAKATWMGPKMKTYVATDPQGHVLGTFYIKPNQPGQGQHVCNCGYMVSPTAQGRGIARLMCTDSLKLAKDLGYRAMQYNLVVSTNAAAVHVWQTCGFTIIGTLPKAFKHPVHGLVDAHIMYKEM